MRRERPIVEGRRSAPWAPATGLRLGVLLLFVVAIGCGETDRSGTAPTYEPPVTAPEQTAPDQIAAGTDASVSVDALEERLSADVGTLIAVLLSRFLPPLIGLVLLVLWSLRREKVRIGLAPQIAHHPPTTPFNLIWTGGLLIAAPGIALVAFWTMHLGDVGVEDARPTATFAEEVFLTALGTLSVAAIIIGRRWRLADPPPPRELRAILLGMATLCVASVLVVPSLLLVAHLLGDKAQLQDIVLKALADRDTAWLVFGLGVFIAPLGEEAIFRGMLYPALRSAFGGTRAAVWIAAISSSAFFSAIHGSLLAGLPLFLLAMVLTALMERTNSLLACVVAHAMHNGLTMLPILLLSTPS